MDEAELVFDEGASKKKPGSLLQGLSLSCRRFPFLNPRLRERQNMRHELYWPLPFSCQTARTLEVAYGRGVPGAQLAQTFDVRCKGTPIALGRK